MKNVLIFLILLGAITKLHAQNLTGKYFIGGSLGFETTSGNSIVSGIDYNNPDAYGSYSFSPSIGYYLNKNLAIGLQFGYSSSTENLENIGKDSNGNYFYIPNKITIQSLNISPLLRYTIFIVENIGFNLNFTLPFTYERVNYNIDDALGVATGEFDIPIDYSIYSYGINISPGFQCFITKYIAVLGTLGALSYTHYKTDAIGNVNFKSSITYANDLKLSLTTGFSLGATFYFDSNNSQIIHYSK